MFRIILLIFISIYFLGSFVSQILTSYIPFKQSQTINIYEFLEEAINEINSELSSGTGMTNINELEKGIPINYQGNTFNCEEYSNLELDENGNPINGDKSFCAYYMTGITNFGSNSGSIATVNGVVIVVPWKVNSKHGQNLEVFVPIIEEEGELLYTNNSRTINNSGSYYTPNRVYLKLKGDKNDKEYFNSGSSIMYGKVLEKYITDGTLTGTGFEEKIDSNIFEKFNIDFKQQKINTGSFINFGKDYNEDNINSLLLGNLYIYKLKLHSSIGGSSQNCQIIKSSTGFLLKNLEFDTTSTETFTGYINQEPLLIERYKEDIDKCPAPINKTKYFLR